MMAAMSPIIGCEDAAEGSSDSDESDLVMSHTPMKLWESARQSAFNEDAPEKDRGYVGSCHRLDPA